MNTKLKDLSSESLFISSQVLKVVNITYRQLSYWELKGIVKPTFQRLGSRDFKRYTQKDIDTLKSVKKLLDEGYALPTTETLDEITKRKELEQKLKESEARYRDLFDNVNDIILSVDAEGNIVYFNRMLSELTDYSEQELKSMNIFKDLIAPDFRERTKGYLNQLIKGDTIKNSLQCFIKKDKQRLYLEFSSTAVRNEKYNFLRTRCILRDITKRRCNEEIIRQKLEFEKTVSRISSRFVIVYNINDAINASLAEMGRLSGASRCYLFLFSEDQLRMDNTHEWCAEGVSPQKDNLQNLPSDMFPWWIKKLRNGEVIHIKDVSKLPQEAKAEKEILEKQDIKSVLVLPLNIGRKLGGFIGFDNVVRTGEWSNDDLALLRIASEILGNALERKKIDE